MSRIAEIIDDGGPRLRLRTQFDRAFVDEFKASLPPWRRSWDQDGKFWSFDRDQVDRVCSLLRAHGYRYRVSGSGAEPAPWNRAGWAETMFAALPAELHTAVYRALAHVLHPDRGGDAAAMQALNDARRASKR